MEFAFYLACFTILVCSTVACSAIPVLNPKNTKKIFLFTNINILSYILYYWVKTMNFQENYYLQAYSIPIIRPVIA